MDSSDVANENFSTNFTSEFFSKAYRIISIILITGVIIPEIITSSKGNQLLFSNFRLFGSEGNDFWVRIGAIYPLLTGAVILYLNSVKKLREIFKVIPFFILAILQIFIFKSDFLEVIDAGMIGISLLQSSSLFIFGITLILLAGLLFWSGNLSIPPKIIGAAGGVSFFLYIIIPIQVGGALFGLQQVPLISFFDMIGMGPAGTVMGICMVINLGFLIIASVFCFLIFKPGYNSERTGKRICFFWMLSQIAFIAGLFYTIITSLYNLSRFIMILLMSIKFVVLFYGTVLLIVFSSLNLFLIFSPYEDVEFEPKEQEHTKDNVTKRP